jgi:hypothetical protein
MPQHDRASLVGAVRDRAIELLDEFEWSAHRPWETVLVGHGSGNRNWLTSIQSVCEVDLAIRKDPGRLCGRNPHRRLRLQGSDERQIGEGHLLLLEAAIFLGAAVPAARSHARRQPGTAIGYTN